VLRDPYERARPTAMKVSRDEDAPLVQPFSGSELVFLHRTILKATMVDAAE
jgi:hypothetical protein